MTNSTPKQLISLHLITWVQVFLSIRKKKLDKLGLLLYYTHVNRISGQTINEEHQQEEIKMAGYNGFSKSNNAIDAETSGRFPLTKAISIVAHDCNITKAEARKVIVAHGTAEYHHTSKHYNTTDYYDTEAIIEEYLGIDEINNIITEKELELQATSKSNCKHNFELRYRDAKGGKRVPSHYKCRICDDIKEL